MWKPINRSCGQTARRLGEYLDGTLPLRQRRLVEAHLKVCAACRGKLSAMRGTLALLAGLPRRELSAGFDAALRERLVGTRPPARRPAAGWALLASLATGSHPTERCLRAPWPSPVRRLAPAAAAAAALGLLFVKLTPTRQQIQRDSRVPAYVKTLVHEHQMLTAGADLNATVVSHNLNGDLLGDGEDE